VCGWWVVVALSDKVAEQGMNSCFFISSVCSEVNNMLHHADDETRVGPPLGGGWTRCGRKHRYRFISFSKKLGKMEEVG
jgi:hypothetical protein